MTYGESSCLLIRGLEILSSGKRKKERGNVEDEEVKKEMMKSEAKLPVVPPPAVVLKPSPQRPGTNHLESLNCVCVNWKITIGGAVSNVLSLSRFLSQKKTSNSKDPDLISSSAIDHAPTIPGIPRNNPISWTDRRMTFGQLETATHGKRACISTPLYSSPHSSLTHISNTLTAFLAVLLCRRHPYDKKSLEGAKQDWYLWDPTSKVISPSTTTSPPLPSRRRKTILSVWRDQSKFQPTPGTILALRNLTIDKHWNDTIADQNWKEILDDKRWDERIGPPVKMVKVNRSMGHGNVNAFATTPAEWFLLDASGVEGYSAVKKWWEGVGRREWEAEVRIDERLKKDIGVRRESMRREREAVLAKQRIGAGAGGGGEGLKRKREPEEEDYAGMDDLETERLMLEELKRDRNFGNG